ncbi:hypothetical protein LXL04_004401 [Taraxacum kok-saghyz]
MRISSLLGDSSGSAIAGGTSAITVSDVLPALLPPSLGLISPSSISMSADIHVSEMPSSSSSSSSESDLNPAANGLKGTHSSSTSNTPIRCGTPPRLTIISSFNFFLEAVRMQSFPTEMSLAFQNEQLLTRTFPKSWAMTLKLDSSQAFSGTPVILIHVMRSNLSLFLPNVPNEENHFCQMFLLALNTSAALSDLNFMKICIPPRYFVSDTSNPSIANNVGKLQRTSKLFASPTSDDLQDHSCTSLMSSILMVGGGEKRKTRMEKEQQQEDKCQRNAMDALRAVQMRTIIGGGNGGTNLGHLFQFAADQFSDAGALLSVQHM